MRPANLKLIGLVALATLLGAAAAPVYAADIRGGQSVAVTSEETVRDDLYVAANTVTIDGTIEGDLLAVATSVLIRGRVTGGVFAIAENLVIDGPVDGDLRALGRTVNVSKRIGGDMLGGGESVTLLSQGLVGRDALVAGGTVALEGPVGRHVRGAGTEFRVNAAVGGDIDLVGVEELTLGPGAKIAGNITFESAREIRQDRGAQVSGQVIRHEPSRDRGAEPWDRLMGTLFHILAVTVLGAAALIVTPRGTTAAGTAVVRQTILSLGWGFGLLVGIPLGAVLLLITLVGIPVAIIALVVYAVLLYASQTVVALGIGRLLLTQLRAVEGYGWSVVSTLVGALILAALRSVPFLEGIATLVVVILGLGAMWLAYTEARAPRSAAVDQGP